MIQRLILTLLLAPAAYAANVEIGVRYVSTLLGDTGVIDVPSSLGFAANAAVLLSPRLSIHVEGAFFNPEAILTSPNIDLGTLGIDALTLSLRFRARDGSRFSPYAGAGAALITFGNLEDRFGDAVEADVQREQTYVVEAGVRSRISPRVTLDLGASYLPARGELHVRRNNAGVSLPPSVELNPIVVGVGITRRF